MKTNSWRRPVACAAALLCMAALPAFAQGKKTKPVRVSVVGDSIAVNIGSGLRRYSGTSRGMITQVVAEKGCGLARGTTGDPTVVRGCDRWHKRWDQHLDRFGPEIVVVVGAGWDVRNRKLVEDEGPLPLGDPRVDAFLKSEYEAAVELLGSRGAKIIFLTSPCIGSRSPAAKDREVYEVSRTRYLNDEIIRPLAAASDRVEVIDLYSRVCPDDVLLNSIGGMRNVRPDGIHFSQEAAVWLGAWLYPQVEAIALREREVESEP